MLRKIFYFKERDGHYIIQLFNSILISFKHKKIHKWNKAKEYGITIEKRNPQIIVSLTSYPARMPFVHVALNTLLTQTLKPDRVILWLAEEQFPNKENDIPEEVLKLKNYGLEIRWCEDIKSYKKLLPSLREFPEDIIVTADDDLIYDKDWLEKLYKSYEKTPNCIHVHRVSRLIYHEGNTLTKPSQRSALFSLYSEPSYLNSVFGGSGCLYPPHTLSEEVFNMENCNKTVGFADDLWFWAMATLKGTKICEVSGGDSNFKVVAGTTETALSKEHANDNFIEKYYRVFEKYPEIVEKLKEEEKNANKR